jgi:hypothetical protein
MEPDITVYADEGPRLTFEEIEEKAAGDTRSRSGDSGAIRP